MVRRQPVAGARADPVDEEMEFLIITGLSGAGKSLAIQSLEDLGFFCVDNLPPALIPKFAEIIKESQGRIRRVALVIDIRGGEFFDALGAALANLDASGIRFQILFLDASAGVLAVLTATVVHRVSRLITPISVRRLRLRRVLSVRAAPAPGLRPARPAGASR